jgi:predicted transposase YbfD/YdcC
MASSLLERMIVTDRVVTGDALYCQRQLCEQVVGGGGDYLLIVKSNQKRLYEDIELCFETPVVGETYGYAETEDSHGERREYRRLWATDTLKTYLEWPGHGQVMKVESWRSIKGKTTRQVRYAITSLGTHTPADRLLQLVRDHWRIENGLHYVRDVTMGEDGSCVRTGSAPQVMAALRNVVIGILRLSGATNIASAIRTIGWQPNGALRMLGLRS